MVPVRGHVRFGTQMKVKCCSTEKCSRAILYFYLDGEMMKEGSMEKSKRINNKTHRNELQHPAKSGGNICRSCICFVFVFVSLTYGFTLFLKVLMPLFLTEVLS